MHHKGTMDIAIAHDVGLERVARECGVGKHGEMFFAWVLHPHPIIDTFLGRMKQPHSSATHPEIYGLRELAQISESLRTEALLMPAHRGLLGVADDIVIPVALDRDFAYILANIDDFLRMR